MWHKVKGFFIILYLFLACEWNVDANPCKHKNNCTCLEHDLERNLIDSSPPYWKNDTFFSNTHNITRALYPSESAPARVVHVEVTLYNSSDKSTRKMNYVWAISSIYTILPPKVLAFVSLGTMYHTSTKLQLSVDEFCADVPGDTYLKNAIFSLEDLSIIPASSDPRLNTAKCVFQKEGREIQLFPIMVLLVQIVFSLGGGYCISFYWVEHNEEMVDECARTAVRRTTLILVFLNCISILIVGVLTLLEDPQTSNPICLYILYATFFLPLPILSLISFGCLYKVEKSKLYFYPFSFMVCFHFSWASLGVLSNLLWALPVLLTILTTVVLIYLGLFYGSLLKNNADNTLLRFYAIFFLTFCIYISFTWMSARVFFTNQVASGVIQTLLTAGLAGLTAPILKWKERKKTEKKTEEEEDFAL